MLLCHSLKRTIAFNPLLIGVQFSGGVIVSVDSRATQGPYIGML
jgi:20S proteasome alpha/beta subunit